MGCSGFLTVTALAGALPVQAFGLGEARSLAGLAHCARLLGPAGCMVAARLLDFRSAGSGLAACTVVPHHVITASLVGVVL